LPPEKKEATVIVVLKKNLKKREQKVETKSETKSEEKRPRGRPKKEKQILKNVYDEANSVP
jgi:hypothetical protein